MKPWIKWTAGALVLALVAAGALRALAARKTQQDTLAAQEAASKAQVAIALAPQDLVQVQSLELTQDLPISGPLKAVHSAFVKARVAGELQGLSVREGDGVKAGQVVARVDSTESLARVRQAQQQAEAARAQVDIAKRSFENNRSLVNQGFISQTALESSSATLAAAEASYRAAQAGADVATKSLDDTVLRAPISGQVAQRLAQPGERVAVDTRILEIVDLSRLELEASLSPADSLLVRAGQTAQLSVEGSATTVAAKVSRVNPSAVAGSRAVLAYLTLEPNAALRQGLFAQGKLHLGSARTLALPLTAVRTDKPQPYVQTVQDGQVQHQAVAPGARGEVQGQSYVAVQGLTEGTQVLAGSVGPVRAGTKVKNGPATKDSN
ncbi:efflux RND transporter periplasmic adaptor subunit [uncultured Rhodoferax sp.]|uniref:efflux RND transporter periplasmic adaptor subunit n=1 Tax=uncultured Rhodoferax sp. TaxID=223188 RepID=UPI0025CBE18D|nr:efflux RND transporter periplasmic adaptor subunit [uncultured Rhodoferax sp.]